MKNTRYELDDTAMENVVGGNTIKPNDSSFWYSYNPEFHTTGVITGAMKDTSEITDERIKTMWWG